MSLLSLTPMLSPRFVSFYISTDFFTEGTVQSGGVWSGMDWRISVLAAKATS